MKIKFVRNINKYEQNRIEFLFINFDFYDGDNIISKLFKEEFGMSEKGKINGLFYNITKLYKGTLEYDLIWHEDVGNYIFSLQQGSEVIDELEKRMFVIVEKLNSIFKEHEKS